MQKDFVVGDYVSYERENEEYGVIVQIEAGQYAVKNLTSGEVSWMENFEIDYMTPVKLEKKDILRFVRYEISYEELTGFNQPYDIVECSENILAHPSDILAAVDNMLKNRILSDKAHREWLVPLVQVFMSQGEVTISRHIFFDECFISDIIHYISDSLIKGNISEEASEEYFSGLENYKKNLETALGNIDKAPSEWKFNEDTAVVFLTDYCKTKSIDDEIGFKGYDAVFENEMNSLYKKDVPFAVFAMGYSYLFGIHGKRKNIKLACENLNRAYEMMHDESVCAYAGLSEFLLGDYETAYEHMTVASLSDVDEACVISYDMLSQGYGVQKCPEVAFNYLATQYKSFMESVRIGNIDTVLPDICCRLSRALLNGYGVDENPYMCAYFWLISDFTSRVREMSHSMYGVHMRKLLDIKEFRAKLPSRIKVFEHFKADVIKENLTEILGFGMPDGGRYVMHINPLQNNIVSVVIETLEYESGYHNFEPTLPPYAELFHPRMFCVFPQFRFAGYMDRLEFFAENFSSTSFSKGDDIIFDSVTEDKLLLNGKTVMVYRADAFYLDKKFFDKAKKIKYGLVYYIRDDKTRGFCLNREAGKSVNIGDKIETYCGDTGIVTDVESVRYTELNKRPEAFDCVTDVISSEDIK